MENSHIESLMIMDCDRCQIWTQLQDAGVKKILHRNIADLINGVRRECWWCIRVLKHLQDGLKSLPDSLQGHPSDITYETTSEPSFEFQSFACLEKSWARDWESSVYFEINGKSDALGSTTFSTDRRRKDASTYAHTMEDNTGSQKTWEYITHRLKNCEINHKFCQQTPGFLPSRLIEIREDDGRLHFRLVHTTDGDVRSRYITLSHRWGTNVTIKLTSQELPDFVVEIPQQRMPQKYIDAAVIALRLKIPYLWIDSLVRCPGIFEIIPAILLLTLLYSASFKIPKMIGIEKAVQWAKSINVHTATSLPHPQLAALKVFSTDDHCYKYAHTWSTCQNLGNGGFITTMIVTISGTLTPNH